MRILTVPSSMQIGGSQLNAVELADALHRRGHVVAVLGADGPLGDRVRTCGMTMMTVPEPVFRPSPSTMRRLNAVVADFEIDVVHGYEWPPIVESVYGPFLRRGVAAVGTVMSMGVAPFIPSHVPLIVGTARLAALERTRRHDVTLMEPPVDTDLHAPSVEYSDVRARYGIHHDDVLLVMVSRLAESLKMEGLLDAITAVGTLGGGTPVHLMIVGDGPARGVVESAAARVNALSGGPRVTIAGHQDDPRPYYAAADIALGMGSSAIKALAFAKPLVVQGELGFWRVAEPDSLPDFLDGGWYGLGPGDDGATRLEQILRQLVPDVRRRSELATFGRALAVERYGLTAAALSLERVYARAMNTRPARRRVATQLVSPLTRTLVHEIRCQAAHKLRRGTTEDFNAIDAQVLQPTPAAEVRS